MPPFIPALEPDRTSLPRQKAWMNQGTTSHTRMLKCGSRPSSSTPKKAAPHRIISSRDTGVSSSSPDSSGSSKGSGFCSNKGKGRGLTAPRPMPAPGQMQFFHHGTEAALGFSHCIQPRLHRTSGTKLPPVPRPACTSRFLFFPLGAQIPLSVGPKPSLLSSSSFPTFQYCINT